MFSNNQYISSHIPSWTSCPHAIHPDTHSPAEWGNSSQWKQLFPTRSFLGLSQPIRGGLLVHLTLFLAWHSQSQGFQHTWCIVVCLLVVGRLTLVRPPHRCPLFWSQANQMHRLVIRHTWPGRLWVFAFCLVRMFVCASARASQKLCYPIPTMLCCLISRRLSLHSWLDPLLETKQWALCCPLKEPRASAIKRDKKKKKHVYWLIKMIRNRTIGEKWKVCECRLSVIKSWGERQGREGEKEWAVQTSHCEGYE